MKIRSGLSILESFLLATIVVLAMSLPCVAGQMQGQTTSFELTKVPLSVHGELEIDLNAMPAGREYVVGIRESSAGKTTAMGLGQVIMGPSQTMMHQIVPTSTTDWKNFEIGPNSVRVNGLGALKGKLLLFARVPRGTGLTLLVDRRLVARLVPEGDVVIQDGKVSTESNISIATLVMRLIRTHSGQALPDVIKESSGVFVATPRAAISHVISYSLPSPSSADEEIFVKLKIDANGNVVSANSASYVTDAFSEACEQAIWRWKFRPFCFEGKPVAVLTGVALISMQHVVQIAYTQSR